MHKASATPVDRTRRSSLIAEFVQIGAAPLLIALWALVDAGLPWTIWNARQVLTQSIFAFGAQAHLREDWRTWFRVGALVVIFGVWLIPCVRLHWKWFVSWRRLATTQNAIIADRDVIILTAHVAAMVITLSQLPWLSRVGLPSRLEHVIPAAEEFGNAMLKDWPNGTTGERAGWNVGRIERMSENRFYILETSQRRKTTIFPFTETLGDAVERDAMGNAVVIDLNSFDMHDNLNSVVLLRSAKTQVDEQWMREHHIRWDERIQLRPRLFLVRNVR